MAPDERDAFGRVLRRLGREAHRHQGRGRAAVQGRERAAASTGPEIFLPYLSGERTPHNDPAARGVLFGLNHDSDAAAIGQAVLEGVAFAFADGLDALIEAGATIDKISVIGGGARSMWWGGVLAAALKRPLIYRDASEVGPAFGAARLARIAKTRRTGGGCLPSAAGACGHRTQRPRYRAAGAKAPDAFHRFIRTFAQDSEEFDHVEPHSPCQDHVVFRRACSPSSSKA